MKEQSKHKIEAKYGLSMLKHPYNSLLFDYRYIGGFDFFLILWVQILSYLPLLQEGTTANSRHSAVVIIALDSMYCTVYQQYITTKQVKLSWHLSRWV